MKKVKIREFVGEFVGEFGERVKVSELLLLLLLFGAGYQLSLRT